MAGVHPSTRDLVYISYCDTCKRDREWYIKLNTMIEPLAQSLHMVVWAKASIKPGDKPFEAIKAAQARARLAVLLVSPSYLARPCWREEAVPLLEAAEHNQVTLLWQEVTPCNFECTLLKNYAPLLGGGVYLHGSSVELADQRLKEISGKIRAAWENAPTLSQSLAGLETSTSSQDPLRQLEEKYSQLTPTQVDRCFRQACEQSYGQNGLRERYPDLPGLDAFSWPILRQYFESGAILDEELLSAFTGQLRAGHQLQDGNSQTSYIALVIRPSGQVDNGTKQYEWAAFRRLPSDTDFQTLQREELEETRGLLTFQQGRPSEAVAGDVLCHLVRWAQINATDPLLEIFVPVELLDADWPRMPVEDEFGDPAPLLESHPYLLRPVERLDPRFHAKRGYLRNKLQRLIQGDGEWLDDNASRDPRKVKTIDANEHIVAIRCAEAITSDPSRRLQWFKGVVLSMVPLALWNQRSTSSSQEFNSSLIDMGIIRAAENGFMSPPHCRDMAALAHKRREHGLSEVSFLVDDPDRLPALSTTSDLSRRARPAISA